MNVPLEIEKSILKMEFNIRRFSIIIFLYHDFNNSFSFDGIFLECQRNAYEYHGIRCKLMLFAYTCKLLLIIKESNH